MEFKKIFYEDVVILLSIFACIFGFFACIIGYCGIKIIYRIICGISTTPELDIFVGFIAISVSIMMAITTYTIYRDIRRGYI